VVRTAAGELAFQHYFVRERCAPQVTGFRFAGAETARPRPDVLAALADPALEAAVIAPSNPFISVESILATPGYREALASCHAPVVAVSPIVGGRAVKGPTAKMMRELGLQADALAVARRYLGLIDGFVLDHADAAAAGELRRTGLAVLVTATVMTTLQDRVRLARETLEFARGLAGSQSGLTRRRARL
jgi:LPPG:FO 2-phospho-L-lactate transferase